MPKKPNFAKFFSVYLSQNVDENWDGECLLDCPFQDCENPVDHFFGNFATGEWHCKRCDQSGNARTLLTLLHAQYVDQTTDKQYKFLSRLRFIGADIFKAAKWAYDDEHDRWLVPYFTYDPEFGKFTDYLNNLGYFFPSSMNSKKQFEIHNAPALPLYLYNPGMHPVPHKSKRAVICEGQGDTLVNYELEGDTGDLILGKPGAGFNVNYFKTLSRCDEIVFRLDNDPSGRKQVSRAIRVTLDTRPDMKIKQLDWSLVQPFSSSKDSNLPGKDLRDLWIERPKTMAKEITDAEVPFSDTPTVDNDNSPPEKLTAGYVRDATQFPLIRSFEDYMAKVGTIQYTKNLDTKLAMAATFAITTAISVTGEPIWAFLIGPPSSGKTSFIESFGGTNQWFDNLSKITAESFVSGWRDETDEEPSYLPSLKDKTLFVKDFTVTLQGAKEAQQKVFGLLTDIYDGHVKIHYGNNQTREFHDTYFNMVAGVTDIVHAHSSASIGERFLRIDWLGKGYDPRAYARSALANFGLTNEQKLKMTTWTLGFVKHLRMQHIDLSIEPQYVEPILDLAEFIAIIRTKVEMDRFEGMMFRPRSELPTRLAKQLAKLYVGAKVVVGSPTLAFQVVRKIALDTCYGFPLDIVQFILEHPYATREQVAEGTRIHPQRAYRVLKDLCTTGVLSTPKLEGPKKGKPPEHYDLNDKLLPALAPDKYISSYESYKDEKPSTNGHATKEGGPSGHSKNRSTGERPRPTHPRDRVRPFKPSPSKRRN